MPRNTTTTTTTTTTEATATEAIQHTEATEADIRSIVASLLRPDEGRKHGIYRDSHGIQRAVLARLPADVRVGIIGEIKDYLPGRPSKGQPQAPWGRAVLSPDTVLTVSPILREIAESKAARIEAAAAGTVGRALDRVNRAGGDVDRMMQDAVNVAASLAAARDVATRAKYEHARA